MTTTRILLCAFLALMLPGLALANQPRVDVGAGAFEEQRGQVQADLADGETYSEISQADRAAVIEALGKMESLLGGRPVSALTEAEKVQLMNAQSLVNTRLTAASEDSRLVCRREAAVGSRLQRSQCLTVAQRRRQREESQEAINAHNRGFKLIGEP
ncbi:hypothetical protein [Luteimonas terricola]|uniref:Secreted protein n=1 Tax=Luteimonas terricola TaxID=645597 RepID=A0ABQ2EE77_9GAMM|nr:hypothetical protein [Luteimonas terricola]GGK07859.1 hypothetical protein GCM10011394_16450 [Luteimonas terricola]